VASFFDRSHSVARPGFNRWLVPPAALCIHLCIGEAYAFSVFTKPMAQAIGVTAPKPGVDWTVPELGWIFSIAILFLGLSSAVSGKWVERVGPRMAMFVATLCFSGGLIIASIGADAHALWLVYLGYGVIGGCGLGIGYISPVSTLIKWFPDRPGLATGTAIMGFGGGALIGAPLSVGLMRYFANSTGTGVAQTMLVMGILYFIWMFVGALIVRVPAEGWKPAGYVAPVTPQKLITTNNVLLEQALKTPQFYLLWLVLCLNVTAGIGVLGQASLMIQEMFGVTAVAAAGFVGLMSIFNMGGRIFWASMSDFMGRKTTYVIFFVLGAVLYFLVPTFGHMHAIVLFVLAFLVIISMYGGGFSTIPAYLRDLYGTVNVGAIHGAILTAWSVAGVAGPVLVNYIREYQIDHGVAKADAYSVTMYIMAVLLVIGLVCNIAIRPVHERHHLEVQAAGG
jgi:MFS family permease